MYLTMLVVEISTGISNIIKIIRIEGGIVFITFIWVCTKLFGS